jgi:hypothetical protein
MSYILTAIIGFLGGITSGLFGVGGGVLFVPLLILMRSFDAHLAIGTSFVVIVPTALMAAVRHGASGMIDWKTAFLLAFFAVFGAWLGSELSLKLDILLLRRLFAIFLLILAVKLFFQN